jgi:hypothetical protein
VAYEQEYGIWTISDNDRKLIKLDISLIYVAILWPNGWLVCWMNGDHWYIININRCYGDCCNKGDNTT